MRKNKLVTIPKEIGNLVNLRYLKLSNNMITSLPNEIGNLKELILVYLTNNKLNSIPKTIGKLSKLQKLYLGGNKLTSIPKDIGNLKNLNELILDDNCILSLPSTLVNKNYVSYENNIEENCYTCEDWKKNLCSSCSEDDYQCEVNDDNNIYYMRINNQDFSSGIPDSIFSIKTLKELFLVNDNIQSIPKEIENFSKLKRLDIRGNKITELPIEIFNLSQLRYLKLSDNNITSLPNEIGNLKELILIYLTNNKLKSIPEEIGNLSKLQKLYLGRNKLKTIPEIIGDLKNMVELILDNNCIISLPSSLADKDYVSYENNSILNCAKLPFNFKWGAATSAYQIEGAWNENRGDSIWDYFSHVYPSNIESGDRSIPTSTNGDIACDSFNKFEEDVKLLKIMNANHYSFSISWPRLFPDGQSRKVNNKWNVIEESAKYYDMVIDTLIENGITPIVTLNHRDFPYALHEKYGGWLDYHSQDDFSSYAEFCFERYGDRVKNWITFNDPSSICVGGYGNSLSKAPFRCTSEYPRKLNTDTTGLDLEGGCSYEIGPSQYTKDSEPLPAYRAPQELEDVWCSHNIILAHSKAVKIYRDKFQKKQNGLVGIVVGGEAKIPWEEPNISEEELENNKKYANLAAEFTFGWYLDPLFTQDYPASVKQRMGNDIPEFTSKDISYLENGKPDFIGWNAFTSHWVSQALDDDGIYIKPPTSEEANYKNSKKDIWEDNCRGRDSNKKCIPPTLGSQTGSSWNTLYGPTIRIGLKWLSDRYGSSLNNGFIITGNGCAQPNYKVNRPNDDITLKYFKSIGQKSLAGYYGEDVIESESDISGSMLHDSYRIDWYEKYLENLSIAIIEDGIDVRGFMAWSLMDNFEWENGYETRFGMAYIDHYNDRGKERVPKDSISYLSQWYTENVEQE